MEFVKGHGTENDFVVLPDPDGELDLDAGRAGPRALRPPPGPRRRRRAARGAGRTAGRGLGARAGRDVRASDWFMDYRNADGSLAEMCGNGVRVFARYLVDAGFVAPGVHPIAHPRRGPRGRRRAATARSPSTWARPGRSAPPCAVVGGREFPGDRGRRRQPAPRVRLRHDLDAADLDALDLGPAPRHDAGAVPGGVNVEFVTPLAEGAVRLRVHERGSGETRSCGTGTVAGAVAALRAADREAGEVVVHTPGGRLVVGVTPDTTSPHRSGRARRPRRVGRPGRRAWPADAR